MTDVYDETLRLTLQRDLAAFEKAGMTEEAGKVTARLAELDKEQVADKPKAKTKAEPKTDEEG